MSLNDLKEQCEYLEGLLNEAYHLSFYDKNEISTAMNSDNAFIHFCL